MPSADDPGASASELDLVVGSAGLAWSILESLPGASFMVFDADLRVVAAGGQGLRRAGFSHELIIGRLLRDFLPASAYEKYLPLYERALLGTVSRLEATSADATAVYESEFSPLRDGRGMVAGGMVVSRDVTEARAAQAALLASEHEFHVLADNSTDLILRCSLDSIVEFASRSSETILGIKPEDLVGRCIHDFMHRDDHADLDDRRARVYGETGDDGDGVVRMEGRLRRADGRWTWAEATARPIIDPSTGKPVGAQCAIRDITERRAAEEALRLSEGRHRLLLENLPDALVVMSDRDLVCRFIGGGGLAKSALRATDCLDRGLDSIYAPYSSRTAELVAHNRAALAGQSSELVLRSEVTGKDYALQFLPLPGERDEIIGTMMIATDVTEKLARETRIVRLAQMVAATGEAIISTGPDGRIDAVNPRACELFGYTEQDMVGLDWAALVAREARPLRDETRRAVLDGEVRRAEHDHITRDGRRFPAAVTLSAVFDASGTLIGRTALIADVSERRLAERLLVEANQRFAQTIANAPIGMALVGLDGRWLEVNRALCEIVGYEADDLLAMTFRDITHPDDADSSLVPMQELLDGARAAYELEKRYVRADGTLVWTTLTVSLARDADGRPLHFICQILDINDRKTHDAHLRREADADSLTGALSRRRFTEALGTSIASARRDGDTSALLFIDLDGFKAVNDTHGHHLGDDVLKAVTNVLCSGVRATDHVGRHGGDEFVVLLDRVREPQATQLAQRLLARIQQIEIPHAHERLRIDASIGLAMLDGIALPSTESAYAAADHAMYQQKTRYRPSAPPHPLGHRPSPMSR